MTLVIREPPRAAYSRCMHSSASSKPASAPAHVFVPFFIASLTLTLTWGATLGMINLARLTGDWGLGTLPRPSVWAHAYVQVFGFMALFIMGVAAHVLPRFVGGALQYLPLVRWSFWLQVTGVVTIACGFFHGPPFIRPLWIAGSAFLVLSTAFFAAIVLKTLANGVPGKEPFRRWVAAGAVWLLISAGLALAAAVADEVAWHRVVWMAALVGFTSSWIFGVGSRILPIFLGCIPRWPRLDGAVFIAYEAGAVAWVCGAWPDQGSPGLDAARLVGALLLVTSVAVYTASIGLFAPLRQTGGLRSPHDGWQRYVFGAWTWLFVSLLAGPGWTVARLMIGGNESLLLLDISRHALAFGFAAQMVLGVASRVVPNFTGKPLWSPRARDAAFYLLNASMLFRAIELPIAFGYAVDAWPYIALAGPLGVAAMVLFSANIVMTVRAKPAAAVQGIVPAHALRPTASHAP